MGTATPDVESMDPAEGAFDACGVRAAFWARRSGSIGRLNLGSCESGPSKLSSSSSMTTLRRFRGGSCEGDWLRPFSLASAFSRSRCRKCSCAREGLVEGGRGTGSTFDSSWSNVKGNGATGTSGVLFPVPVELYSISSGAVDALTDPLRERLRRRLGLGLGGGGGAAISSLPLICSTGSSFIRSPSLRNKNCRAAERSPPVTVLLLPTPFPLGKGGGVPAEDDWSYASVPPVSFCMAFIRAAALLDRNRPFWSASNVGSIGVMGAEGGGDKTGY